MLAIPYGENAILWRHCSRPGHLWTARRPGLWQSNGIPIIVPCHRVLAAEGIGGYSGEGGIEMKIRLLKHEGRLSVSALDS